MPCVLFRFAATARRRFPYLSRLRTAPVNLCRAQKTGGGDVDLYEDVAAPSMTQQEAGVGAVVS